jgi:hypothetical protein
MAQGMLQLNTFKGNIFAVLGILISKCNFKFLVDAFGFAR